METRVKQVLAGVLGAALALAVMHMVRSALAASDGSDATEQVPRVIPWEGSVALNGAPYDGLLAMRFTLYDDAGEAVWSETWDDTTQRVPVVAGELSALLGSFQSIEGAIADAADLSLGVEVRTGGAWTTLGGRQRLAAAPYGLWAARSSRLTVAGTLAVGGAMSVAGSVTSGQDVRVGARVALGSGAAGPHGLRFGDTDAGGQLAYRTTSNSLELEARNDLVDAADRLRLDLASGALSNGGTTSIHGPLAVSGGLAIAGGHDLVLGPDTTPDSITGAVDEPWLRLGAASATGATSLYFGSSADTSGLSLTYYPSVDASYLESGLTSGTPGAASARYLALRAGGVDVSSDLEVDGYPIVSAIKTSWSPEECLEDDSIDKVFKADANCVEGAIKVMVDSGPAPDQPGLCACFDGASQNQTGQRGWHCFL